MISKGKYKDKTYVAHMCDILEERLGVRVVAYGGTPVMPKTEYHTKGLEA